MGDEFNSEHFECEGAADGRGDIQQQTKVYVKAIEIKT